MSDLAHDLKPRFESENKLVFPPLERGFGTTLGNSLRRVLLSSLPGVAVTHVRIENVLHEFSTLPGMVEDTTELILNIKRLCLRFTGDRRSKVLRLVKEGVGRVTAADIDADPEVEILNPELHLAELTDRSAKLSMDIYIECGVGYVAADKQVSQEQVIGLIPVDSLFSPIRRVNYTVEDTRVRQKTDYDKLTLEVVTDGSIRPDEAVRRAALILQEHMAALTTLSPHETLQVVAEEKKEDSVLDLPVESLGLSVRSLNCLKRAGVRTVGDLHQYSEEDVMKLKNFGQKSLDEIKDKLNEYGLGLSPSSSEG